VSELNALMVGSLAFGAALSIVSPSARAADDGAANPLAEWSVSAGYSLTIAARGFDLPTAVVPVPTPGAGPKSPRFFVTELRGHIKVVANDGSVSEFSSVPTFKPHLEWPDFSGEAGLAGICLEPEHGYVFVTYAYRDAGGVLRNGITRFTTQPTTFDGPPTATTKYLELLAGVRSSFSHQIGGCLVDAGGVYIGVGDGGNPAGARDVKTPVGKVLRLTLDGQPHPDNVFAKNGEAEALIYAYGLRNPFGLTMVQNKLFAAENGVAMDRLLAIRAGQDHIWDGTDASIGTNALAVFNPTIGPAHLTHAQPNTKALAPSGNERFVIAASNSAQGPGVLLAELDAAAGVLVQTPSYLVHYDGGEIGQAVTGVAMTDDGLYFTPILPLGSSGVILKTSYDPAHAHPQVIGKKAGDPIATRACLGCHSLHGMGAHVGPPLDENSLVTRTETKVLDPSYGSQVEQLDTMGDAVIVAGRVGRHEVLDAPREKKVRAWVINRVMNPRFDMPDAAMPQLGIQRKEAEQIADQLLGAEGKSKFKEAVTSLRFLGGLSLGLLASAGFFASIWGWRGLRRRRAAGPSPATATESG
jgi:Glucose / Sorbosone dehydrogenase